MSYYDHATLMALRLGPWSEGGYRSCHPSSRARPASRLEQPVPPPFAALTLKRKTCTLKNGFLLKIFSLMTLELLSKFR